MATCYLLDPGPSRFTVQAFASGMLSALAHSPVVAIRDFTGELRFDPDRFEDVSLRLAVRADSLEVTDNVRAGDRREIENTMRKEVLETERYPEIVFQSTGAAVSKVAESWYRLLLQGTLSLHGVVNTQQVDTQLRVLEDGMRLHGEFKLSQSAYRIKRVTAVGGMITLKDELKFAFDIVGQKGEER